FGPRGESGPRIIADVASGDPAAAITTAAADYEAQLVVIGTRGATGLRHLVVGSVTEQVIRTSPVPGLSVSPHAPATPTVPFVRVLFATDLSASSLAALDAALKLDVHPSADVTVLHVIDDADEDALFVARFCDVHRHVEAFEDSVRDTVNRLT